MAGGIFTNRPFEPNPKCIVFSIILMLLYWFLPRNNNIFMLPVIFVFAYVGMAWYDYLYDCQEKMYTGKYGIAGTIDSIFKPQLRNTGIKPEIKGRERDVYLVENQEQSFLSRVYLFHIIAIFPLLFYIGYYGQKSNKYAFEALLYITILGLMYHGLRLFYPREPCK